MDRVLSLIFHGTRLCQIIRIAATGIDHSCAHLEHCLGSKERWTERELAKKVLWTKGYLESRVRLGLKAKAGKYALEDLVAAETKGERELLRRTAIRLLEHVPRTDAALTNEILDLVRGLYPRQVLNFQGHSGLSHCEIATSIPEKVLTTCNVLAIPNIVVADGEVTASFDAEFTVPACRSTCSLLAKEIPEELGPLDDLVRRELLDVAPSFAPGVVDGQHKRSANRKTRDKKVHTKPSSPPVIKAPEPVRAAPPAKPEPFGGGELVFLKDRVELCGVNICSGSRSDKRRKALGALGNKRGGVFVAYSGKKLAEITGCGAAGLVRDVRERISDTLLKKANIKCGRHDVILSGDRGYRLKEWITIHEGKKLAGKDVDDPNAPDSDDPNVPDPIDPDDPNLTVPDVEETLGRGNGPARRARIVQELMAGRRWTTRDIARELRCSLKTAKRDMRVLRQEGKVKFVGAARTGYYRANRRRPP